MYLNRANYHERYGVWSGKPKGSRPDYSKCAESVLRSGEWISHQCSRNRGHGPGRAYCRQHAKYYNNKIKPPSYDELKRYIAEYIDIVEDCGGPSPDGELESLRDAGFFRFNEYQIDLAHVQRQIEHYRRLLIDHDESHMNYKHWKADLEIQKKNLAMLLKHGEPE